MSNVKSMPGHLIRRMHQISVALFADKMAKVGIDLTPVQYAALEQLDATPEIDQTTLARAIAYDKVTIGGVVDRLRQKGFVTREPSALDKRARVVKLSDAGREALEQARPYVAELQEKIVGNLTDSEAERLTTLLKKATAIHV
jgi:DNA-binding MarR family transcriptional regulator